MPDIIKVERSRFVREEPVLAAAAAFALVSYVMTQLVTLGVITSVQASTDTKFVLPPITALFVLALGIVARRIVYPLAAFGERVEAEVKKRVAVLEGQIPELKPLVQGAAAGPLREQAIAELQKAETAVLATPAVTMVLGDAVKTVDTVKTDELAVSTPSAATPAPAEPDAAPTPPAAS